MSARCMRAARSACAALNAKLYARFKECDMLRAEASTAQVAREEADLVAEAQDARFARLEQLRWALRREQLHAIASESVDGEALASVLVEAHVLPRELGIEDSGEAAPDDGARAARERVRRPATRAQHRPPSRGLMRKVPRKFLSDSRPRNRVAGAREQTK